MSEAYGGGIYINNADVKLQFLAVKNNYLKSTNYYGWGAGIYFNNSNSVVYDISVYENTIDSSSWAYGGGIYLNNSPTSFSSIFVYDNRILGCDRSHGVGIYINNSNAVFSNISVYNNSSDTAIWAMGTGIYLTNSNAILSDILVYNNKNDTADAAMGGGIYSRVGSPTILNASIFDNISEGGGWSYGAGLFIEDSDTSIAVELTNIKVTGNYVNSHRCYGAGIFMENVIVNMNNILVASNTSGPDGYWYNGIGIRINVWLDTSIVTANNLTIVDNIALTNQQVSGGLLIDANASASIKNSIIWNTDASNEITGTPNITHSIIRGGYSGIGNISSAPIFLSPIDYHLAPNSPGIGAGDPIVNLSYDIDNNQRPSPVGTNPDMGCYEIDQTIIAINEIEYQKDINFYPNPAIDKIQISTTSHQIGLTEIFDLTGKKVKEKIINSNKCEIDINELENGFYFLRFGEKSFKMVKQ